MIETPEEFAQKVEKSVVHSYAESPNGRGGVVIISKDYIPAGKLIAARDAAIRADERQKAAISEEVINSAINELSRLTGEDFHGYRSEIWRVLIRVSRNELSGIGEKPPAIMAEPEEATR